MAVTNYVTKLSREQADKLQGILTEENWELDEAPYALFRARRNKTTCIAYESGKLVVQGKATEELVQFILEPRILQEVRLGYETYHARQEHPEMFQAHAGIDESGKGDFFGPMVIACCYVDEESAVELLSLGVQDSKAIKSDKRIAELTRNIRDVVRGKYSTVRIGNAAYNRMHNKLQNVNLILAWGHARALENLLDKQADCPRALSDQFGHASSVKRALMERGKRIILEQRHKAESDIAVAAASILARNEFIEQMARMGENLGLDHALPRGASAKVIEIAVNIVRAKGPQILPEIAKTHFRTAQTVLEQSGFGNPPNA